MPKLSPEEYESIRDMNRAFKSLIKAIESAYKHRISVAIMVRHKGELQHVEAPGDMELLWSLNMRGSSVGDESELLAEDGR